MPLDPFKPVIVGTFGAPFGVAGWVKVNSFTAPLDNILRYQKWYVNEPTGWKTLKILNGRVHGKGLVAQLEGIDDRDQAALLCHTEIGVAREELSTLEADQFYWADLEGLLVQTEDGKTVGHVQYLYENAGTDVLVVKDLKEESHIPFLMHDTIVKVDLDKGIITINWDLAL